MVAGSRRAARETQPGSIFAGLLRGYSFTVCETPLAISRALGVRRRVYGDLYGAVPIPDRYDHRSWFLLAEHVASGDAVGSMRVTPRSRGPLEAEEYFRLPAHLATSSTVEITRFATLPAHRDGGRFLPVVALGLFKLAARFVALIGARSIVICSRPERVRTYRWLGFERTGLIARYHVLGDVEHELMTADVRAGVETYVNHQWWEGLAIDHPEVVVPAALPALGLGGTASRRQERSSRDVHLA